MLSIAEKYQRAFEVLGEEDSQLVVPTYIDWENARAFVKYLKTFYNATLNISGSTYVTSNLCFLKLCVIEETLNEACFNSDPIMKSMGFNMKIKYERYSQCKK